MLLCWGARLEVGERQVGSLNSLAWQTLVVGIWSRSRLQPGKPYASDRSALSSGSAPFRLCGSGQLVHLLWPWVP